MTFAIGVPAGARTWLSPSSRPFAPPTRKSGQRMWLCRFESAIADPYMTIVLSSSVPSPSVTLCSFSRKYGIIDTWYVLILANSRTRSSRPPWCDAAWYGLSEPLSG